MRALDAAQTRLYSSADRTTHTRVDVDATGAGGWADLSSYLGRDWLDSVDWGDDNDSPMATAEVRLTRAQDAASLAPLVAASRANVTTPTLAEGHGVRIYEAVVPKGTPRAAVLAAEWMLVFDGEIDAIAWEANPIVLTCRDTSGPDLADAQVFAPGTYPSVATVRSLAGDAGNWAGTNATIAAETGDSWLPTACIKATATASPGSVQRALTSVGGALAATDYTGSIRLRRRTLGAGGSGDVRVRLRDTSGGGAGDGAWVSAHVGAADGWQYIDGVTLTTVGACTLAVEVELSQNGDVILLDDVTLYPASGVAMEDAIQELLDTWGPGGWTLAVPVSPAYQMRQWAQAAPIGLLDACNRIAQVIGWEVRRVWNAGLGAFALTLQTPDRSAAAAVHTFGPADYLDVERCEATRENVRNRVTVIYTDATSGLQERLTRNDATSQAAYGLEPMIVVEEATGGIDNATEAGVFADAAIADLSTPDLDHAPKLRPFAPVELHDYVELEANGTHYDTDQTLAVVAYQHHRSREESWTRIDVRGKPALGPGKWLAMECRPGGAPAPNLHPTPAPAAPSSPKQLVAGSGYVLVAYDAPTSRDWDRTEIHASTTSGFEPDSTTLAAESKASTAVLELSTGSTWYLRVRHRTRTGAASTSPQISIAL